VTDRSTILSPLLHLLVPLGHSILYGFVLVLCNDGCQQREPTGSARPTG